METLAPAVPAETFATRLKQETAQRHSRAEHSTFMADLMGGKLDATAYLKLLGQYQHIYRALEEVSDYYRENPHEATAPFVEKGLDRAGAIAADLAALGQSGEAEPLPATREYVSAILATKEVPERFLAHHYLRYLGDLSGGQAVAALVARHYGIGPEALSMYRFPDLPKPKVFKDSYRGLLDNAPLSEAQRDALVDEALAGFDYNAKLFAELEASL